MTALLIFIGGGSGAVLRWLLTKQVNTLYPSFPLGIFLCNTLGCFIIGWAYGAFQSRLTPAQIGFTTGFLGGFTTFSTFSLDTYKLLQEAKPLYALVNIGSSILIGLLAVLLGSLLGKMTSAN